MNLAVCLLSHQLREALQRRKRDAFAVLLEVQPESWMPFNVAKQYFFETLTFFTVTEMQSHL